MRHHKSKCKPSYSSSLKLSWVANGNKYKINAFACGERGWERSGKGFFLVLSGAARNCLRTDFGLFQLKGVFGSRRI